MPLPLEPIADPVPGPAEIAIHTSYAPAASGSHAWTPKLYDIVMSADEILMDVEERMEKALGVLKHALTGIRTGRANPGLVDSLRVEVYGSQTPIKQLAA